MMSKFHSKSRAKSSTYHMWWQAKKPLVLNDDGSVIRQGSKRALRRGNNTRKQYNTNKRFAIRLAEKEGSAVIPREGGKFGKPIVNHYKQGLTKSKDRVRDLGEVFTPDFLVDQMLDNLPEGAWGKNKKWLEPTCGDGQFILGIIRHKIIKGFDLLRALDTTFGMDIMKDNVSECKHRIYVEVVLPYFKDKRIGGKTMQSVRWKAVCIVENNIVHTKNSLDEDYNHMWMHFADLEDDEKKGKMKQVQGALAMIDGEVKSDGHNALYRRLLEAFRGQDG